MEQRGRISAFWTRALWMRLAAISVGMSVTVWLYANFGTRSAAPEALRQGAQVQFMHGMATFACATFMNIGAHRSRFAPAFFLSGALLFCGPIYAVAFGAPEALAMLEPLGIAALLTGWGILSWSAGTIDRT